MIRADFITIDQENVGTLSQANSFTIFNNRPIGQSFVPTLNQLNLVELQLQFGGGDSPVQMFVNIRANTVTGTIVGTSETLSIPFFGPGTQEAFQFGFATDVSLVPGSTYVIEAETVSPDGALEWSTTTTANYPNGDAIIDGNDQPTLDFGFREGIGTSDVPEPASLLLTGMTALGMAGYAWRRRKALVPRT